MNIVNKIKEIINEHKIFFSIFFVAIALLCLEYVVVNTYVDKKTKPKKNRQSNIVSNINDLNDNQKQILGIATNSNKVSEENTSVTSTIIDEKKEKKLNNLSNSNVNKKYKEYEEKSDEEKKKMEVIPSKEQVDIDKLKELNTYKNVLPSKYDLSEVITFNRQEQNPYGLCWDFASTKVFESYLELRDKKHYNFSEIVTDYLSSDYLYGYHILHEGGNFNIFNDTIHRFGGLVEEKDVVQEYEHDFTFDEYTNFYNLPKIKIEGYEVVHFPTLYYDKETKKLTNGEQEMTDADLEEYRMAMKNHIMNNSAIYVYVHIFDESSYESRLITNKDELVDEKYSNIERNRALYCSGESCTLGGDHAMVIVGWDDNFDRRMFRSWDSKTAKLTDMAEHNGAFIALDSHEDLKKVYYISYDYPYLYGDLNGIKTFDTTKGYDLNKIKNKEFKNTLIEQFKDYVIYLNDSIYLPYSIIDDADYISLDNLTLTLEDINVLSLFKNIEYVAMNNVTLESISFLNSYTKLETLSIENSNIVDISSLSNLNNLSILDLNNNNITDISPLGNLKNLESLSLANNNITDISVIKNFNKLMELDLSNNKIVVNDDSFTDLVELQSLNLKGNGLSSLTLNSNITYVLLELSDNPNIQLTNNISVYRLYVDNNNLNNLDILTKVNNEQLNIFSAKNNNISNLQILSNFKNLSMIDLSYNKNITDFSPITSLFEVKKENNTNSAITSFFFGVLNSFNKKYDEEEHIKIDENDESISSLNPGYLYLNGCNISDISIFNYINIAELKLADNNITSVENFKNNYVNTLDLSNNKLENSNLSSIFTENMSYLYLSYNGISELNFEINNSKNLQTLDLSNNDITDISKLKDADILVLSLEKNINLKSYPKDLQISFLNLSDTAIGESLIENLNLKNLYFLNISSNRTITDYSLYLDKLIERAKNVNEELAKNDPESGIENSMEEKRYVNLNVLLPNETLNNIKYSPYVRVNSNYELNKDSMSNIINLVSAEYYPLLMFINSYHRVTYNNIDISRDYTKLTINDELNSYIEYTNSESETTYKIRFN